MNTFALISHSQLDRSANAPGIRVYTRFLQVRCLRMLWSATSRCPPPKEILRGDTLVLGVIKSFEGLSAGHPALRVHKPHPGSSRSWMSLGLRTSVGKASQPHWAERPAEPRCQGHVPHGHSGPHSHRTMCLALPKSVAFAFSEVTDVLSGPPGRCTLSHICCPSLTCAEFWNCLRRISTVSAQRPPTHRPSETPVPPLQSTCTFPPMPAPALCMVLAPVACGKWRSREETRRMPRAPPFRVLPACSGPH